MAERGKARKATTPKAAAPKTSPSARKAPSTPAATRSPKSASKPASNVATRKSGTDANTPLPDALPVIAFVDEAAWETWLIAHADAPGLWLKIAKKTAGIASVDYAGALDVALCHGWIDGQKRGFDAEYFLQRFTPRRPKSLWSKINIGHVERLIAAGRMRAGGQREIDAAKADGRWAAAYDGASRMDVPEALAAALARDPKAAAFFETLNKTNRYAVCWRVQTAKTEATRTSRVEALVAMLARGEKIHG
jgi:uncharacterized protein YdeI (YjbR/CyaY-like superfamily)